MADRIVDVVVDTERWLANHPGAELPTGQVVEADFRPTSKGFTGKPWHQCVRCGHVDREGAMSRIGGKWYCNYSGCATEVSK